MEHRTSVVLGLSFVALVGCARTVEVKAPSSLPTTTISVATTSGSAAPESASTFVPPPPLGAESPAAPDATGGPAAAAYLEAIHRKVHPRWSEVFLEELRTQLPPADRLNQPDLSVVVDMALAPDGTLRSASVRRSSGIPAYDQAAVQVVQDAAPYPLPPAELVSDDGSVHVAWQLARDVRQCSPAFAQILFEELPLPQAIPMLVAHGAFATAGARIAKEAKAGDASVMTTLLARGILVTSLGDQDEAVRAAACAAAGALGDAELLDAVRRRLVDPSPAVRAAAAFAAGHLAAAVSAKAATKTRAKEVDETVEPLGSLLDDPAPEVVGAAVAGLAALGRASDAVAKLAPSLSGGDPDIVARTAEELAEAGDPALAAPLAVILKQRKAGKRATAARTAAASALGALPAADAARPLEGALADPEPSVRAAAAWALAHMHGAGRGAYYALLDVFRDPSSQVRAAAAAAALRAGGADAVGELYVLVEENNPTIDAAMAKALADVPGSESLGILRHLLAGKDTAAREAAAEALAARDDGAALLAPLANDADPVVRGAALSVAQESKVLLAALGEPGGAVATVRGALLGLARLKQLEGGGGTAALFARAMGGQAKKVDVIALAAAWLRETHAE